MGRNTVLYTFHARKLASEAMKKLTRSRLPSMSYYVVFQRVHNETSEGIENGCGLERCWRVSERMSYRLSMHPQLREY